MEEKVNNFVNIDCGIESVDDVVNFSSPLAITDDSRQWNMTKYDIPSLDISDFDGVVTINHGQSIADVVGKTINLRKDKNKVLIDGIKFAINSNPVAILAKNLMKDGFVSGVSIETIGGNADETGTWRNHKLSGLSIVAHPNNKNAYAVVANSIQEAEQNHLDIEKLSQLIEVENSCSSKKKKKAKNSLQDEIQTINEIQERTSNKLDFLLSEIKMRNDK